MATAQETHSMIRHPKQVNNHLEKQRYCNLCGAQIEGPNAWGHDDDCPKKES